MHAPLYAALRLGAFEEAGLEVELLGAGPREERLSRLRSETVDVALLDLASFVDAVADEPGFPARCVLVLTGRLPMAAHFVLDRDVGGAPLRRPADLLRARYGAPSGTAFHSEHRALLRRLGDPAADLHVDLSYGECFDALATGDVDVVPDFAGISPRFRRVLGDDRHGLLRYRDCGVRAYGTGFVATQSALDRYPEGVVAFLAVVRDAYRMMRTDPSGTAAVAAEGYDIDPEYAVDEWRSEEETAIFGFEGRDDRIGTQDAQGWSETITWRREVAGKGAELNAGHVYVDLDRRRATEPRP